MCVSLKVKVRLYEAIILSTLLYSAEVWPLRATLTKRLNEEVIPELDNKVWTTYYEKEDFAGLDM